MSLPNTLENILHPVQRLATFYDLHVSKPSTFKKWESFFLFHPPAIPSTHESMP